MVVFDRKIDQCKKAIENLYPFSQLKKDFLTGLPTFAKKLRLGRQDDNCSGARIQKSVVRIRNPIWAKRIRREQAINAGSWQNVPCPLQWLILAYFILDSEF